MEGPTAEIPASSGEPPTPSPSAEPERPAGGTPSPAPPGPAPEYGIRRVLTHWATGWFVAALALGTVVGLSVALAGSPNAGVGVRLLSPAVGRVSISPALVVPGPFGRSFRAGRVQSVSGSGFTMTTPRGATVKVDEQSSTVYRTAGGVTGKSMVGKGDFVIVFGKGTASTVKATEVVVVPAGAFAGAGWRPFFGEPSALTPVAVPYS